VNEHRATQGQNHEFYEELAAALALGTLEGPDRAQLAAHLQAGCARCDERLPELLAAAEALLLAEEPVTPPAALRGRILRAAGVATDAPPAAPAAASAATSAGAPAATPAPAPTAPRPRLVIERRPALNREALYRRLALVASLLVGIVSWRAFAWHSELDRTRRRAAEVEVAKAQLETEVERLRTSSAEQAALIDLLRQPGSGLVTLASLAPAPNASGRVLWDPKAGRGYLWVNALPPDPTDKDYQLWAIIEGKPVSAGVFSVTADGSAVVPLLDIGRDPRVAAFAITLEPAGGLPAPSGQMVLMGPTGA
jgi:anti-sigma-K factor RskA